MTIVRTQLEFAVQSKEYTAKQYNAQVCKNWYGIHDENAKFKNALVPFPGSLLWSDDLGLSYEVRGMYSLNGVLYVVVDNEFRIYNDSGMWVKKGNLNTNSGQVKFMANDNQIFISDVLNGYVYQVFGTSLRAAGSFFTITNSSSFIGTAQFSGSGLNDLTTSGTYIGTTDKTYVIEIQGQSQSSIGAVSFVGSALNDMKALGNYIGAIDKHFRVQIETAGTVDKFKWSADGGASWIASGISITTAPIDLQERVQVQFGAITGHHAGDYWDFTANASGNFDTFKWSDDNGSTWLGENIQITGGAQTLNDGVIITFAHLSGHTKTDRWTFDVTIDSAFYPPITPIYLDSYGLFIKSNTERFYLSSSEDFAVINALDYANTNAFPDDLVCGVALNEEIVFIGLYTTEVWYDTGSSPFPLQRRPNLLINWGTTAPYSLAWASNNSIFWLAQSVNGGRVVVEMNNYNISIISDKALNDKLQEYTYVDDAFGMVIEWTGKIFYFLTIPSADVTWVWDSDSKVWRQRTTLRALSPTNDQDYVEGRYLANCHVYHNGEHYIGDWKSGKIYKLSNSYYKDGTMPIINEAISPPLHKDLNRMSIYSFEPVFEAATALDSGQGSDPLVMLQISKDGGFTWNSETTRTLGQVGEFTRRCKFNKVGYGRQFVFKIRISDPIYKVLMGAIVELEDSGS